MIDFYLVSTSLLVEIGQIQKSRLVVSGRLTGKSVRQEDWLYQLSHFAEI